MEPPKNRRVTQVRRESGVSAIGPMVLTLDKNNADT